MVYLYVIDLNIIFEKSEIGNWEMEVKYLGRVIFSREILKCVHEYILSHCTYSKILIDWLPAIKR